VAKLNKKLDTKELAIRQQQQMIDMLLAQLKEARGE